MISSLETQLCKAFLFGPNCVLFPITYYVPVMLLYFVLLLPYSLPPLLPFYTLTFLLSLKIKFASLSSTLIINLIYLST